MDFLIKVFGSLLRAIVESVGSWLFGNQTARVKRHLSPKHIKFLKNWGPLIGLAAGLSAMGTYIYFENKPDTAWQAQARMDFASLSLPQAISKCRDWPNNELRYRAPLALAWQAGVLDWYLLEAANNSAMRRYSCDGTGITAGKRYERVLLKRAPLHDAKYPAALEQNLFDVYATFSDSGVLALEVAEDPQTGKPVERRWLASGQVQMSNEQARLLPVLLGNVPPGLAAEPYPQLTAQERADWVAQHTAAFALLSKHVPANQHIAELYIEQKTITVMVVAPVGVPAQAPAAFGELKFDAYGVASHDTWQPTPPKGNTCQRGRSLSEIQTLLAQESKPQTMAYAWFDCDPRKAHNNVGDWYLRDARTHKGSLPPGRH